MRQFRQFCSSLRFTVREGVGPIGSCARQHCVDIQVRWIMSHLVAIPSSVSDSLPLAVMSTASSNSCDANSALTSLTRNSRATK